MKTDNKSKVTKAVWHYHVKLHTIKSLMQIIETLHNTINPLLAIHKMYYRCVGQKYLHTQEIQIKERGT